MSISHTPCATASKRDDGLLSVVDDTRRLLLFIFCTDEANFARDGINNTRKSHWWSEEHSHATLKHFNVACLPVFGAL